jgi:hypothetical protein
MSLVDDDPVRQPPRGALGLDDRRECAEMVEALL